MCDMWLIHMCDMTHSHLTWIIQVLNNSHLLTQTMHRGSIYMCHAIFARDMWLVIFTRHICMWLAIFTCYFWYLHVTYDKRYLHVTFARDMQFHSNDFGYLHVTSDKKDLFVTFDMCTWHVRYLYVTGEMQYLHVTWSIHVLSNRHPFHPTRQPSPFSPNRTTAGVFICDVTHSYVSCLILELRKKPPPLHPTIAAGAFIRDRTHSQLTWIIHTCDVTYSYMRHDLSICVTWLIRISWEAIK